MADDLLMQGSIQHTQAWLTCTCHVWNLPMETSWPSAQQHLVAASNALQPNSNVMYRTAVHGDLHLQAVLHDQWWLVVPNY